jgi:hypothetical protein
MVPAFFLLAACLCLCSCSGPALKKQHPVPPTRQIIATAKEYGQLKMEIAHSRKKFRERYIATTNKDQLLAEIKNYWVSSLGTDLYEQWKGTPWDFNGTTQVPGEGAVACGYFVTGLLQGMGYRLDRVKLSVCPSLTMMKSLAPEQPVLNLSYLSYHDFNERIKKAGNGVWIAGLDFHTGFIINDGTETWFLHSNYIDRQGVIKEKIAGSAALQASKTRFVVSLTEDEAFLQRWMKN